MNSNRQLLQLALVTGSLLVCLGCNSSAPESDHEHMHGKTSGSPAHDFSTNVTAYEVKGALREIRANGWKALIDHEDIPGYMEAMTMLLDVKDTNELAALRPGDSIQFRMLVTETDGWIDRVRRTGTNVPQPPQAVATTSRNSSNSQLFEIKQVVEGDLLPDCALTNQAGNLIKLADFRGKALAFTFIFTRCPFPVYCPRMNKNLSAAQNELSRPGSSTNWHLLSISFDPEWDTPTRLETYARSYKYNPSHWSFATGDLEVIRDFSEGFGLMFYKSRGTIEHNVRTVVVGPGGRVQRIFTGNDWTAAELVTEMKKAMQPPKD